MHTVEPTSGTFTQQELERLAVYRAAVAAGFYTDWYDEGEADLAAATPQTPEATPPAEQKPRRRRS